jgi:hypothetical protein
MTKVLLKIMQFMCEATFFWWIQYNFNLFLEILIANVTDLPFFKVLFSQVLQLFIFGPFHKMHGVNIFQPLVSFKQVDSH